MVSILTSSWWFHKYVKLKLWNEVKSLISFSRWWIIDLDREMLYSLQQRWALLFAVHLESGNPATCRDWAPHSVLNIECIGPYEFLFSVGHFSKQKGTWTSPTGTWPQLKDIQTSDLASLNLTFLQLWMRITSGMWTMPNHARCSVSPPKRVHFILFPGRIPMPGILYSFVPCLMTLSEYSLCWDALGFFVFSSKAVGIIIHGRAGSVPYLSLHLLSNHWLINFLVSYRLNTFL